MNIAEKLRKALKALGVTGYAEFKPVTNHPAETRCMVQVDGEPFGVFDTDKQTFVD